MKTMVLAALLTVIGAVDGWTQGSPYSLSTSPAGEYKYQWCVLGPGIPPGVNCVIYRTDSAPTEADARSAAELIAFRLDALRMQQQTNSLVNDQLSAMQAQLKDLTLQISKQNEAAMISLRGEMIARFEKLPLDLVRDKEAYALLLKRLKEDLDLAVPGKSK
ncbi:hypothetical protein [Tardiphaga sp. 285_C5_N1_2]|uniref:hypothetical protein n=1 Tax=Tardiphaga sp. 285_C5_N1_2 TaxID=3240775 RepID=UPI003F8A77B7